MLRNIGCLDVTHIQVESEKFIQKPVEVRRGDTPEILQRRVMEQAEWVIMPEAVNLIANGRVHVEDGHAVIDEKA